MRRGGGQEGVWSLPSSAHPLAAIPEDDGAGNYEKVFYVDLRETEANA